MWWNPATMNSLVKILKTITNNKKDVSYSAANKSKASTNRQCEEKRTSLSYTSVNSFWLHPRNPSLPMSYAKNGLPFKFTVFWCLSTCFDCASFGWNKNNFFMPHILCILSRNVNRAKGSRCLTVQWTHYISCI